MHNGTIKPPWSRLVLSGKWRGESRDSGPMGAQKAFEISQLVDFKRARRGIVIAVFYLYVILSVLFHFTGTVVCLLYSLDRQSVACKRWMDYCMFFVSLCST